MKRVASLKIVSILTIIFFIGFLQKVQAQVQTCTVLGKTDGNYGPFDIGANGTEAHLFSGSAYLYLSTEICYATINAVQFWVTNTAGSPTFPVKLYMKTVAAGTTSFSAGTYSNMLSGATLVYTNAAQTWLPFASVPGVQTFALQTPFTYTTGNLIIIGEADYNLLANPGQAPVFGYKNNANKYEYWYSSNSLANLLTQTGAVDKQRAGVDFSDITVVLPIELTNFTAQQLNTKTKLEWATASETDNKYFTVERSLDGKKFIAIGTVQGADNSNTTLNYSTFDEEPAVGINYYRLKQTDFNGDFKYSSIVSATYVSEKPTFNNIHPNPTTDNISFNLYSPAKAMGNVQITDITGRVISNELQNITEGNQELSTSLNSLEKGIYYLKVSIDELGFSHTAKIIKN